MKIKEAKLTGKNWAVIADYEHAGRERGEIVSRHKSHDLARKSAKRSGYDTFLSIRNLEDYLD